MSTSRPLILSLLIALCAAMVAAQSPSNKIPDSSRPLPVLAPNAEATPNLFQFQLPVDMSGLNLLPAERASERKDDFRLESRRQPPITLELNDTICYTVRTYRVARENPDSDAVRPAGYSTCQRASRFQFRTAVDSREVAPR